MSKKSRVTLPEKERALDWLTALSPVLLMAFVYYRWAVLGLAVAAVGGYLAVALLWRQASAPGCRVVTALLTGLLITFCLPATTPWWVAAIAGGIAACVAALVSVLSRRLSTQCLMPVAPLVGYLTVRWIFPGLVTGYTMPVQMAADAVSGATPLATLGSPEAGIGLSRLFLGVHPGAVGEGCVPVLLLAGAYLLLRRRVRLIAPGAMLLTVSLLSWVAFSAPLVSLLMGGVLLAALVLADRELAPKSAALQAVVGVVAGGVTVLLRGVTHTDGSAVAVMIAAVCCAMVRLISGLFTKKKHPAPESEPDNFSKTEN